jgi:hypothetical protein
MPENFTITNDDDGNPLPTTQPATDQPGAFSTSGISNTLKNFASGARNLMGDQNGLLGSLGRLAGIGILSGGKSPNKKQNVNIADVATPILDQGLSYDKDWRVRLLLPDGLAGELYQLDLLKPLGGGQDDGSQVFRGVIFPYTPNITVTYAADWQAQKLTHSNYAAQFYNSSEVQDIQIQGTFTAQNQAEAEYLLAVMTFSKLITKMFFGESSNVGNPPPIMHLYGHGEYQWNRVPVIVKNVQYSLSPDVDYMPVLRDGKPIARVPTIVESFSWTVAPVYSRKQMSTWSYEKFASGELIKGGFI